MVACVMLGACALSAQRVAVGGYVAPLQTTGWLTDCPNLKGKALLVEFFHSTNEQCKARVEEVNELAHTYNNILNVVVVAREPAEQVASILLHDYQNAYVALDEKGVFLSSWRCHTSPMPCSSRHEVRSWGSVPQQGSRGQQ